MRRRLLVPTLAACTCAFAGIATGLLGAAGNYQRGYDPERCAIKSTDTKQTILSNDVGRVWVKDYYGKKDGAHYMRYYACRNQGGRHVFLASAREASYEGDEDHALSRVAISPEGLAGATVAFAKVTCANNSDPRTCNSKLRVVRLDRQGGEARPPIARRHAVIEPPYLEYDGGPMYYTVETPDTSGVRGCADGGCEIHRVSSKGVDKVIDRGTDIRLGSQALAPNGDFFWRNGPEPRVSPPPE
jgi:hypothetical protein